MDEASEAAAVEVVAQGVIGKRVDEMESGFIMALDYMIQIADKDGDDQVTDEMPHSEKTHFFFPFSEEYIASHLPYVCFYCPLNLTICIYVPKLELVCFHVGEKKRKLFDERIFFSFLLLFIWSTTLIKACDILYFSRVF